MEKKLETTKTKNITQKAKKIRSMIMMTLLCVLMMSAATYAWFTLSKTAKVSNMTMTVGDATGLQVADLTDTNETSGPTQESEWKGATSAVTFGGILFPANSSDGITIKEPEYDEDGAVSGLKEGTPTYLTSKSEAQAEGYYVEYSFWMRAQGPQDGTTKIQLDKGEDLGSGIYSSSAKGTYSLSTAAGDNGILPSAAVRISLTNATDSPGTATVFEPNSDYDTAAQKIAEDKSGASGPTAAIKQSYTSGELTPSDNLVFTLKNNQATKITLRLWLEGTDPQCGNEIAAKDIITQLKFSAVTDGNSTP